MASGPGLDHRADLGDRRGPRPLDHRHVDGSGARARLRQPGAVVGVLRRRRVAPPRARVRRRDPGAGHQRDGVVPRARHALGDRDRRARGPVDPGPARRRRLRATEVRRHDDDQPGHPDERAVDHDRHQRPAPARDRLDRGLLRARRGDARRSPCWWSTTWRRSTRPRPAPPTRPGSPCSREPARSIPTSTVGRCTSVSPASRSARWCSTRWSTTRTSRAPSRSTCSPPTAGDAPPSTTRPGRCTAPASSRCSCRPRWPGRRGSGGRASGSGSDRRPARPGPISAPGNRWCAACS